MEDVMSTPLAVLNYAGPEPAQRRSFLYLCWRAIVFVITSVLLVVFVTLRAAVLLAGFVCVFAGTMLLVLGGKRGAAEKVAQWRERAIDLFRLWGSDIARPFGRSLAAARSVAVS
jgi:hypothetical protein